MGNNQEYILNSDDDQSGDGNSGNSDENILQPPDPSEGPGPHYVTHEDDGSEKKRDNND